MICEEKTGNLEFIFYGLLIPVLQEKHLIIVGTAYRTGKKHCGCLKVHYPLIALLHDIQGVDEVWTKV